jgi:glycosidase
VTRFWLERGVDGIRVDVVGHLLKDEQFRDDPVTPIFASTTLRASGCCDSTTPTRRRCTGSLPAQPSIAASICAAMKAS